MNTTKPLDEAEALARAVEALRAASLHQVADGLERFPEDAFSAMRDAFDSDTGIEEWKAIRGAFGALLAVRAGYGVTPPAVRPDTDPARRAAWLADVIAEERRRLAAEEARGTADGDLLAKLLRERIAQIEAERENELRLAAARPDEPPDPPP